jgi:hypothetical protein
MPRAPSNQYVTHRVELGVWERKQVEKQLAPMQLKAAAEASAYVVAAGALGVAAYGLFWWFDAVGGIKERISTWNANQQEQYTEAVTEFQERDDPMWKDALGGPKLFWNMFFG